MQSVVLAYCVLNRYSTLSVAELMQGDLRVQSEKARAVVLPLNLVCPYAAKSL